jgi:hypothetical protein
MFRFTGCYERPKLFNWITVLLLGAWMGIVATVVMTTDAVDSGKLEQTFYKELIG